MLALGIMKQGISYLLGIILGSAICLHGWIPSFPRDEGGKADEPVLLSGAEGYSRIRKTVQVSEKSLKSDPHLLPAGFKFLRGVTVKSSLPRIVLYVLIKSGPRNYLRRKSCRYAWQWRSAGNEIYIPGLLAQSFIIGKAVDGKEFQKANEDVLLERKRYQDIVLYPGNDTYRLLTQKVLWAFGYALKTYDFDMLLSCDDDSFVNYPELMVWMGRTMAMRVYAGETKLKAAVMRGKGARWRLRREEFAADFYPPYCSGGGYILSRDVVNASFMESRRHRFLWVEDVFIGILVNVTGLVRRLTSIPSYPSPDARIIGMMCCEPSPYVLVARDIARMNVLGERQKKHKPLCEVPPNKKYCH